MKKSLKKLVLMSLASVLALGAVESGASIAFADDDDDTEEVEYDNDDDNDDEDDDYDDDDNVYVPSTPSQAPYTESDDDDDDFDDDDYVQSYESDDDDDDDDDDYDFDDDDEYERTIRQRRDKGETFTLPSGEVVTPIVSGKVEYQTEEQRYEVTPQDQANQGLEVGSTLETGETVEKVNIQTEKPIPQIAQENQNNKEALYKEAMAPENNQNTIEVTTPQNQENQDLAASQQASGEQAPAEQASSEQTGQEPGQTPAEQTTPAADQQANTQVLPVKANEKTQTDFNTERFIDVNLLNQEFVNLLNAERQAQGLAPVEYGSHLQQGVDTRATDLASIGDIRVNDQPHVRLDGSSYVEDFRYLGAGANSIGENTAMYAYTGNPYELVSEKALAEQFYQQWKNSPSHYQNMMDPNYKHSAISVKMGQHNRQDGNQWNSIIAVQALDQN